MTPSAATPAARRSRSTPSAPRPSSPHPSTPRGGDVRTPLRRSTAPRSPRRVSGPAGPGRPAGPVRAPRPAPQARPARRTRSTARATPTAPLGARWLAHLRTLPDHALLDRVVRGRLWIPLLGVLLAGIVAMQVELLKLNAGIGHSMVRTSQLQIQNQLLRASDAQLSDDRRIESVAAGMGMLMPPPQSVRFLPADGAAEAGRAAAGVHAPDAASFAAQQAANAAAATSAAAAPGPATTTPSGG